MALKARKANYNAELHKSGKEATNECQWCVRHIPLAIRSITLPEVNFIITTDASEKDWGATDGSTPTGGSWADTTNQHINYLELRAIHFAIKFDCKKWAGAKHLRIRSGDTTAIAYINNMGGTISDVCNNLAKDIRKLYS